MVIILMSFGFGDILSTSPPVSPSPDEVSQERGSYLKRGGAPLEHPCL